jgi:hypothetical protein
MAVKDKVVVGTGYFWNVGDNQKVMAYMPRLDENRNWVITNEQTVVVEPAGGVECGSIGVIDGNVIRVSRNSLKSASGYKGLGNDFVELVPVNLEKYKRVGYFPVDNVRILGG